MKPGCKCFPFNKKLWVFSSSILEELLPAAIFSTFVIISHYIPFSTSLTHFSDRHCYSFEYSRLLCGNHLNKTTSWFFTCKWFLWKSNVNHLKLALKTKQRLLCLLCWVTPFMWSRLNASKTRQGIQKCAYGPTHSENDIRWGKIDVIVYKLNISNYVYIKWM